MAKVKLGRQVEFDHVTYAKGEHESFPDALLKHWYFQALVKDGDAVVLEVSSMNEASQTEEPVLEEVLSEAQLETKLEEAPKKRGRKSNGSN